MGLTVTITVIDREEDELWFLFEGSLKEAARMATLVISHVALYIYCMCCILFLFEGSLKFIFKIII